MKRKKNYLLNYSCLRELLLYYSLHTAARRVDKNSFSLDRYNIPSGARSRYLRDEFTTRRVYIAINERGKRLRFRPTKVARETCPGIFAGGGGEGDETKERPRALAARGWRGK